MFDADVPAQLAVRQQSAFAVQHSSSTFFNHVAADISMPHADWRMPAVKPLGAARRDRTGQTAVPKALQVKYPFL